MKGIGERLRHDSLPAELVVQGAALRTVRQGHSDDKGQLLRVQRGCGAADPASLGCAALPALRHHRLPCYESSVRKQGKDHFSGCRRTIPGQGKLDAKVAFKGLGPWLAENVASTVCVKGAAEAVACGAVVE